MNVNHNINNKKGNNIVYEIYLYVCVCMCDGIDSKRVQLWVSLTPYHIVRGR